MDKQQVISLIDKSISTRRNEVLDALNKSGVILPPTPTDKNVRELIVKEIEGGNGYLVVYLGEVITKDLPAELKDKKSGFFISAPVGAALISTGGGLLGGLFGGGGRDEKAAQQAAQAQAAAQRAKQKEFEKQMKIAASQQRAGEMMSELQSQERKAKTKRTVLTISLIGGAVLIGTVATILILKKK